MKALHPHPSPQYWVPLALSVGALLGLGSCLTTSTSQPAGLDRAVLTSIPVSRAWIVQEDGQTLGSVVRYSGAGNDGQFLYVIRNLWDQDLGVIDERGRAWRRIPHEDDRWIGSGTVVQGVRQILDTGTNTLMVERPIGAVEAATAAARAH